MLRDNGITTLLFTSDTPTLTADWGNIDYELMTANFKWGSEAELERLKELRPNAPIIVTEYWPGNTDERMENSSLMPVIGQLGPILCHHCKLLSLFSSLARMV